MYEAQKSAVISGSEGAKGDYLNPESDKKSDESESESDEG